MARVLAFSCTHCPAMLPKFPAFLSKLEKQYRCNKWLHLGDLVDQHALNFHARSPQLPSASDEYVQTKKQVKLLYERFPKCTLIQGNHCALSARQAENAGIPPEYLKDFSTLWGIEKWEVLPRFSHVEIDGVRYEHGDGGCGGQFGAVKTSRAKFQSTVSGHLHSQFGVYWTANGKDLIFGCNTGWGGDHHKLQFAYGRAHVQKPIVGAVVVLDGHPICVPMDL